MNSASAEITSCLRAGRQEILIQKNFEKAQRRCIKPQNTSELFSQFYPLKSKEISSPSKRVQSVDVHHLGEIIS